MSETPVPAPAAAESMRRGGGCVKWGCLSVIVCILAGGVVVWRLVDRGFDFASYGLHWLAELPGRLSHQHITETFRQEVTRVLSSEGDVLELATMETHETVTKADSLSVFNDLVYLGTTESEIRVPVVYRFHLKLSDDWRLSVKDGRCVVIAPAIRPSLPPAIRTDGMEKKTEAGWLRFNATENLDKLEKDLTPMLEKRAGSHTQIPSVRDNCRRSVAKFVRQWLLRESGAEGAIKDIVVIFPDEPEVKEVEAAASKLPAHPVVEPSAH
ncbi:MAG: hypothetical protein ACK5TH_20205 [Prosthecobacter sp.]